MQGTLKIRKTKKGEEYLVEYVNPKGKTVQTAILPQNRHFDLTKAADNDPLEFDLLNGVPVKCVVPGKEAAPVTKAAPERPTQSFNPRYSGAPRNSPGKALVDAVAPYNFVPFDADAVIPAFEEEPAVWSGTITCSLKALKPLLVCGRQTKASESAAGICRFMQANDQYIIPGTAIKGMLRSLLEILSFSNMEQVSHKHLFWRARRREYKYSAHDLAYPDGVRIRPDFVTRLFGSAGNGPKGEAVKGRVAIDSSVVTGNLYKENGVEAVLGGPKPTCVPLYIRQNPATVTTISQGRKNNREKMKDYNDSDARLRGRKLYWHHDVDPSYFPGKETMTKPDGTKNNKVITRLFPLAEGAQARISIHVDRLTSTELGGLLQAIQLPAGHAHKLGMGKSLGFGSVRLEIEDAAVFDIRKAHGSLATRLGQTKPALTSAEIAALTRGFRDKILAAVRARDKKSRNISDYEQLEPIRALRIMLDYEHRPAPKDVRTMALRKIEGDPLTRINFGNNAILPSPAEVIRNGRT